MLRPDISELARRLGENAETVCRHYLSNGRRQGWYWLVGDAYNSAGSLLYVRLTGPTGGKGARGKWTDAATGEHGDLIDLIRLNRGHDEWRETLDEVQDFLRLPLPMAADREACPGTRARADRNPSEAAQRLIRMGRPLAGSPAAAYLAGRWLGHAVGTPALCYRPRCYHRLEDGTTVQRPALLAAVADLGGTVTGVARTWLAQDGTGKADLADPRRALGHLLSPGVRFTGAVPDTLVAGECLETVLSVRRILPTIPSVAGLSANHLDALLLPPGLRRLYIAREADVDGHLAFEALKRRADAAGVSEVCELVPVEDDFNADLTCLGPLGLALHLAPQLVEADVLQHLRYEADWPKPAVRPRAAG